MKLFYHDPKHDIVHDEFDLGHLSLDQAALVRQVLEGLDQMGVFNNYRCAVLADRWTRKVSEELSPDIFDEDVYEIVFE